MAGEIRPESRLSRVCQELPRCCAVPCGWNAEGGTNEGAQCVDDQL
jgi:hypothetical protein